MPIISWVRIVEQPEVDRNPSSGHLDHLRAFCPTEDGAHSGDVGSFQAEDKPAPDVDALIIEDR